MGKSVIRDVLKPHRGGFIEKPSLFTLPDSLSPDSELKLQNHLRLLKDENAKLQKSYNELEQKYSRAIAANPELESVGGEFSSFISALAMQVANLHGRNVYSDVEIRLQDRSMPGHKFVLSARSSEWSESVIAEKKEIGRTLTLIDPRSS